MGTQPIMEETAPAKTSAVQAPILVVDIGRKQPRKQIRKLREGRGRLHDQVQEMVEEFRENGALAGNGKDQPTVVVVVREKRKRMNGWML